MRHELIIDWPSPQSAWCQCSSSSSGQCGSCQQSARWPFPDLSPLAGRVATVRSGHALARSDRPGPSHGQVRYTVTRRPKSEAMRVSRQLSHGHSTSSCLSTSTGPIFKFPGRWDCPDWQVQVDPAPGRAGVTRTRGRPSGWRWRGGKCQWHSGWQPPPRRPRLAALTVPQRAAASLRTSMSLVLLGRVHLSGTQSTKPVQMPRAGLPHRTGRRTEVTTSCAHQAVTVQ